MSVSSSPLYPSHPSFASPLLGSILQRQRCLVERQGTWSWLEFPWILFQPHFPPCTAGGELCRKARNPLLHLLTQHPAQTVPQACVTFSSLHPYSSLEPQDRKGESKSESLFTTVCAEIQVSFVSLKKNELCSFYTEAEFPSRAHVFIDSDDVLSCASEEF